MPHRPLRWAPIAAAMAVGAVLLSCGGDDGGPGATGATTGSAAGGSPASVADGGADPGPRTRYPLTITNCGRQITFAEAPSRVVLLNGASVAEVESLLALGVEDRIVANSQSYGVSDVEGMVERIAAVPTGGIEINESFEVPKEQTLSLEPDLVMSTWSGGFSEEVGSVTRDQLEEAGINSYVSAVNCANGAPDASPADQQRYAEQTYEESFELLRELGAIFDVQGRAEQVIADAEARIAAVVEPAGTDPVRVLVAYPGMAMGGPDGVPAVFTGSLADSIIEAAGGVNAFELPASEATSINAEALAAADVDVLVIGLFLPDEDADRYAEQIFAAYPQWDAAKGGVSTSVSDSFYLGPYNDVAIQRIADAIAAAG